MPESSGFKELDTGLRRYDELIRASLGYKRSPDRDGVLSAITFLFAKFGADTILIIG